MINILNQQENILNNIELEYLEIIEEKLNLFFDSCIESSHKYCLMLIENAEYYLTHKYYILNIK